MSHPRRESKRVASKEITFVTPLLNQVGSSGCHGLMLSLRRLLFCFAVNGDGGKEVKSELNFVVMTKGFGTSLRD